MLCESLLLNFTVISKRAPGINSRLLFSILTLIRRLRVSGLILLDTVSTSPLYILSLYPENLASTGNPFFIADANVSGIFKSERIIELSSKVIIIELSEPSVSSDNPLLPIIPSKGAIIFSVFNFAIISPFLTNLLNLISDTISDFFTLKDFVLMGIAVPKDSIFSEKL